MVQTEKIEFAMCNNVFKSSPVIYLYTELGNTAPVLFYLSYSFNLYLHFLIYSILIFSLILEYSYSRVYTHLVCSLKMTLKASVLLTSSSSSLSPLSQRSYICVASSKRCFLVVVVVFTPFTGKKKKSQSQRVRHRAVRGIYR